MTKAAETKAASKPKIKIKFDDPMTQAIWNTCLLAREEVASWPSWKRGEDAPERQHHQTPDH